MGVLWALISPRVRSVLPAKQLQGGRHCRKTHPKLTRWRRRLSCSRGDQLNLARAVTDADVRRASAQARRVARWWPANWRRRIVRSQAAVRRRGALAGDETLLAGHAGPEEDRRAEHVHRADGLQGIRVLRRRNLPQWRSLHRRARRTPERSSRSSWRDLQAPAGRISFWLIVTISFACRSTAIGRQWMLSVTIGRAAE